MDSEREKIPEEVIKEAEENTEIRGENLAEALEEISPEDKAKLFDALKIREKYKKGEISEEEAKEEIKERILEQNEEKIE